MVTNQHSEHIARLDAYLRPKTKVQGYTIAEVEQRVQDWERLLEQFETLRDALEGIAGEADEPDVSPAWYRNHALEALTSIGAVRYPASECKHPDVSFDRSLCACGSMHYYCTECGAQTDECSPASEPQTLTEAASGSGLTSGNVALGDLFDPYDDSNQDKSRPEGRLP